MMIQESSALPAIQRAPQISPGVQLHVVERRKKKGLFEWRSAPGFGLIESIVLGLYAIVLVFALKAHEPWGDEAQAWLIARDNSLWTIFRTRLHYEGTPILWHAFLHTLSVLHIPWHAVPYIGAVIAIAGIYVLLRWSPFPLVIRALLPFTFFFQYQYAAIVRSYVFFPLLLCTLCVLYASHKRRIVAFAITAGLLVNLSMHGMIIGSIMVLLFIGKLYKEHRRRGAEVFADAFPSRGRIAAATALFGVMWLAAIYAAIPAPDLSFAIADTVNSGPVHNMLVSFIGEMPGHPVDLHIHHPPYIPPRPANAFLHPLAWAAWAATNPPGGLGPGFATVADNTLTIFSEMAWPIARSNIIAFAFLTLTVLWIGARKRLHYLLPWLAVIIVGAVLWVADQHGGLYFITLLACIWMAFQGTRNTAAPWLEKSFTAMLLLVCCIQIGWSATTIFHDTQRPYDPGHATALYLQQHPVNGNTAAFHFQITSIQPYFKQNPFFNLPTSYWMWSRNTDPDEHYQQTLAQHPARIVYAVEILGDNAMRNQLLQRNPPTPISDDYIYQAIYTAGYREQERFCGTRFVRSGSSFQNCNLIMEPAE